MEYGKIAMITSLHRPDDVRIYEKEARTLSEAGYQVVILSPYTPAHKLDFAQFIQVLLPKDRIERMRKGWLSAARVAVQTGAEFCHLHDPELLLAVPYLKRHGMRVIYDAHEDLGRQVLTKEWIPAMLRPVVSLLSDKVEHGYGERCDLVIGATPEISGKFTHGLTVRNLPTRQELILLDRAIPQVNRRSDAVCYAGAITKSRGIEAMIKACSLAGVKLLLAGEWEDEALYDRMKKLPQYSCVEYRGRLSRSGVAALYAEASAGLLLLEDTPSYRFSRPIKLYEYLCAGLPVVASDFFAWHNDFGEVQFVSPKNVEEIARAIRKALTGRIQTSARCKKYESARRYNFEADAQCLVNAYRRMGERK